MKSLLKAFFLLTFLIPHGDGDDHSHSHNKSGNISGFIIDKDTDEPISYVSISVFNINQSSPIDGGVSDEDGFFNINQIPMGSYNVTVESIGYNSITVPIEISKDKGIRKNLGRINLVRKSIQAEEINIIDKKPIYEYEADKMVYNASEDIITGSGTAEDVLKKVPMVTVDQEGEISLRGNPDVRILVDGRPMRSEASDISASTIEKVEVITSPSAKYNPEGMAGIINIVRKKGNYDGFNGSLRLNGRNSEYFGPNKMNGLTLYSNYRKDKLNFYSSFSINNKAKKRSGYRDVRTDYIGEGWIECNSSLEICNGDEDWTSDMGNGQWDEGEVTEIGNGQWDQGEEFIDLGNSIWDEDEEYTDSNGNDQWDEGEDFIDLGNSQWDEGEEFVDRDLVWDQSSSNITSESVNFSYENFNERYSKRLQLGLDYYFSDELTLNWEFGVDSNLKDDEGISLYTEPRPIAFNTTEVDDNDNYDSEGIFELIKTFTDSPGKEVFFSFSHHNHDDYETETYDDGNTSESSTFNNANGTYEMSLNYKYPINEDVSLEFGYDADYVSSEQSLDFEIDALKGVNDFNYNRGIHALYVEYENKLSDKFSIKPSLRYERVSKEVSSIINLDSNQDLYDGDNVFAQFIQYSHDNPEGEINLDNGALYPNLNFTYNIIKPAPKSIESETSSSDEAEKYKKYGSKDKVYSLQFGLSKRIERPGSFGHGRGVMQIRPFPRDLYTGSFLFIGNPYLKPEYSTQYDISFKGPAPMGFFSTSLFYHEITDKIEWYDDDSYENLDITTFRNSANGYNSGVSLFMVLAGQVFGGTYSKTTLSDASGDYELNEGSTFMNSYFRMSLPEEYISPFVKWWKFDFEYGFYWMKIETPTGDLFGKDGTLWGNISLSKAFLDDKMRVSLSIDNIHNAPGFEMLRTKPLDFLQSSQGMTYDSAYETTDTYNERGGRTISLSFRYNFGDNDDERNKKRMKGLEGGQRGGEMDMGY